MGTQRYTATDVAQKAEVSRKAPKIRDFIGRPGFDHRQEVNPNTGRVEDVITWKPNENGKLTRAAHEINEAMADFHEADGARYGALQDARERAFVTDAEGMGRMIDVERVDADARQFGFHHRPSYGRRRKRVSVIRGNEYVRVEP